MKDKEQLMYMKGLPSPTREALQGAVARVHQNNVVSSAVSDRGLATRMSGGLRPRAMQRKE